MDYLDLKKEFRHRIILMVGYVLIGVAITFAAIILLHQAFGFSLDKNGTVIQNGLTFFSSQPNPANIYANGRLLAKQTNTRLVLPEGIYNMKLTRQGYHDWRRQILVSGGEVHHYDYPFLFPKNLDSQKIESFTAAPSLMTQSPDRQWLLIQSSGSLADFQLYDLKDPQKPAINIKLPDNLLSPASQGQGWGLVEWAGDNRRLMLEHNFDGKTEYILLDRAEPSLSLNLNQTLRLSTVKLSLRDKKYDKYYSYDAATARLQTLTLDQPQPVVVIDRLLAYHAYGDDTILYVTDKDAEAGNVLVKLRAGDQVITIRNLPKSPNYVVNLTKYDGEMYVAIGASSGSRVYIYKDPSGQKARSPDQTPLAVQVLHVEQPNHVSFSASAQFIVAENGNRFGVYDIENESGYNYTTSQPLDAPQTHASWMDGNRLLYISNGKLLVFDYDNQNQRTLVPASSAYLPAFTPDFESLYALSPTATGFDLQRTLLLTPADR